MVLFHVFAAALLASTPAAPQDADGAATRETPEALGPVAADRKAPLVFAELSDDEVLQKAVDWIGGVDTLDARFKQFSSAGGTASGRVRLKRPGFMKFTYDPPTMLDVVATGGLVYVEDTELETADSYPVSETPLKFLLRKDVRADDLVLLGVERGAEEFTVRLSSGDSDIRGTIALSFAAPEVALRRWQVTEPDGRATFVVLSDVKRGVDIPNRVFRAPETGARFLKDR